MRLQAPSDPRANAAAVRPSRVAARPSAGVDYEGATRDELYERACKLGIEGRSKMDMKELARAIRRRQ